MSCSNHVPYPEAITMPFVRHLGKPEKDAALAEAIAQQQERNMRTYLAPGTQAQESAEQGVSYGQVQQQIGNGYFLYPHQAGRTVPIYDPRPL